LDDIKECWGEEIHTLNRRAQDHDTWRTVVKMALNPTSSGWILVIEVFFENEM